MSDETMTLEARVEEARRRGEKAGKNAAEWCFDGNTTDATYRRTLKGIEDGDPMVLDAFSPPDLSGQWAGESIPELLGDLLSDAFDVPEDEQAEAAAEDDDVCDAWLTAAADAFWAELERVCRFHVEG